ncbi:Arrestin domain-containing 3, partial [Brachionus plicatilis]
IQVMRFHARGKSKTSFRNVAVIEYPNRIRERSFENWYNSFLPIPSVCPSSNGTCRIIEISYKIVFNFDASGLSKSKDMEIPIIIGTIPLSSDHETNAPNFPFTYEGCVFGANPVDLSNEIGINNSRGETIESDLNSFKPYYPFYKDFSMNNTTIKN